MHDSSMTAMAQFIEKYLKKIPLPAKVLEIGSYGGNYRNLFDLSDYTYTGADIRPGPEVDMVIPENPHLTGFPLKSAYDVVISGQTAEHCENLGWFFQSVAYFLKPGGWACVIAPWRAPRHEDKQVRDYWRILPSGMYSMLEAAGLHVEEIDFMDPPASADPWGYDTIGIARKPV